MARESFKQYSPRVFGRKEARFRGLRTGQGDHLQDPTWSRRVLNIDCSEFILRTREGQIRRNKLAGLILNAGLLDTVKIYAIGGKVFYEDPDTTFNEGSPL